MDSSFQRAAARSTTLARTEVGEWVIHADWTGARGYPYSVYLWRGEDYVETAWCRSEAEALARYSRTFLFSANELRRSGAAAAAVRQHREGHPRMEPEGSTLGARLPTWALSG